MQKAKLVPVLLLPGNRLVELLEENDSRSWLLRVESTKRSSDDLAPRNHGKNKQHIMTHWQTHNDNRDFVKHGSWLDKAHYKQNNGRMKALL